MEKLKLLVVDDDDLVIQSIRMSIPNSWHMTGVNSLEAVPKGVNFDAALIDMHLDGDLDNPAGLEVIRFLSREIPHIELVSISGDLDRNLMEACLKAGATRFLAKPLSKDEIVMVLDKIEALFLLQGASFRGNHPQTPWIGSSKVSQEVKRSIASMVGENGPILIEGESGVGKEVVARLLKQPTDTKPFISVNVSALPESVFESEVFGHVKGAFTGADQNKMGLAEAAHNGDLFLDEIEALPLNLQAKLLRFLENGEIRRVGAKENIRVNVRVIAATNKNLEQMVKEGEFREDLMWRLSGKRILLPPLRDRAEDIEELANFFLDKEKPRRNKSLSPEALGVLKNYPWPGNVRELKRVFEQLCLIAPLPIIRDSDVNSVINISESSETDTASVQDIDFELGLQGIVREYEAKVLTLAIEKFSDVEQLCNKLQISRSSLYKKLREYGIDK